MITTVEPLAVQNRSSHLCRNRVYGHTKRSSLLLAFTKALQLSYTWLTTESFARSNFSDREPRHPALRSARRLCETHSEPCAHSPLCPVVRDCCARRDRSHPTDSHLSLSQYLCRCLRRWLSARCVDPGLGREFLRRRAADDLRHFQSARWD